MSACKNSCAHRRFVNGYREERARQMFEVVEKSLGYDTEIADELRRLQEQGTPVITFQQYMIQSRIPPEAREMPQQTEKEPAVVRGNPMAEESLLAVAMAARPDVSRNDAVDVLRQLDLNEFQTPVNRQVAAVIVTLYDARLPHDAVAVENHLRAQHLLPLRLDSQAVQGARPEAIDRSELGLQRWEKYAGVLDNAQLFAAEIRSQYVASETGRIYTWGAQMINSGYASSEGVSTAYTKMVQDSVQQKLAALPPQLPTDISLPGLLSAGRPRTPVRAADYALPVSYSHQRSPAMDQALSRR